MRTIAALLFIGATVCSAAEPEQLNGLPSPNDVFVIAVSPRPKESPDYITPRSLLRALPLLTPADVNPRVGGEWQSGAIVLKDKTVLFWRTSGDWFIAIDGADETFFYAMPEKGAFNDHPPAWPEEEARFVAAARRAFENHDADALMALTCWDRAPDKVKVSGKTRYARDVAQTATDIVLISPDPMYPDHEWKDKDGVSYRSNLPVVKQLKITFSSGTTIETQIGAVSVSHAHYPVGEKEGKLFLLAPAPVN